ncbi:hypothetical protein Enr13x_10780 [Stieleria neptunia]|uniref:Uncharacterized protein n=1 Tax=Stieleria neptunia TaxID=2527979 RepID=A0A518HKA7_9BACT|nr:hypothetical protein Enr13x_10780 [Stieleria neptunia]
MKGVHEIRKADGVRRDGSFDLTRRLFVRPCERLRWILANFHHAKWSGCTDDDPVEDASVGDGGRKIVGRKREHGVSPFASFFNHRFPTPKFSYLLSESPGWENNLLSVVAPDVSVGPRGFRFAEGSVGRGAGIRYAPSGVEGGSGAWSLISWKLAGRPMARLVCHKKHHRIMTCPGGPLRRLLEWMLNSPFPEMSVVRHAAVNVRRM